MRVLYLNTIIHIHARRNTQPEQSHRDIYIYIYSCCTSNRLLSRNPSLRKQAIAVLSRPSLYIGYIYIYSLQIYLYRTDRRVFIPATMIGPYSWSRIIKLNLLSKSIYILPTLLISPGASFITYGALRIGIRDCVVFYILSLSPLNPL